MHLLICEKGDCICFYVDIRHTTHSPDLTTNKGRRCLTNKRICCSQTTGACYPLSSAEPGHQRKGHYNDNYPLSLIESAKLCYKLHSALYLWCGVKFIWGGTFYSNRHREETKGHPVNMFFSKKQTFISLLFFKLQLISFFFCMYQYLQNTDPLCVSFLS